MRQQQQPRPLLPTLPPALFSNDGDHSSVGSGDISTFPGNGHLQRTDNDSCTIGSTHTYHHQQDESETDWDFAKMMTLQSIDRLENHLPRIVVDQIVADMMQRKEELAEDNNSKQCPLGENLTLEVPMDLAIGGSSKGNHNNSDGAARAHKDPNSSEAVTEATKEATISSSAQSSSPPSLSQHFQQQTNNNDGGIAKQQQHFQNQQQPRRASGKSTASGVSDLLCTLTSLDELLGMTAIAAWTFCGLPLFAPLFVHDD